jgi:hypothetical protein
MYPIPTNFYGTKTSIKQIIPLPTTNLLAYWDAGLTSSYSASNQQTWFDLSGNGYHLTLTGSTTYNTSSGASIYEYSPAITFNGSGYFESNETTLCSLFNPTASGYFTLTSSLCAPGPLYLDNVDYTILFFGLASDIGGAMTVGTKVEISQEGVPSQMFVESDHEKTNPVGSTGGNITQQMYIPTTFSTWRMMAWSKNCSGSDLGTAVTQNIGYSYTSPTISPTTGTGNAGYPAVPRTYKAANNKLAGSGEVTVGKARPGGAFNWRGDIQAVAIYNKVLSPTELNNAIDYFKFRKLN